MSSFQTVDGRPLRNHYMNVMFTRHGRKAGVSQVNPHRFRHTFATWAIRASARELDVQYLLGHSSPMMVRRYSATYDSEQAAAAHAAFSPAMQLIGESLLTWESRFVTCRQSCYPASISLPHKRHRLRNTLSIL